MALTLNGTTGLSGIVGSAGTPALQGGDTNTGYFFGTDTLGLSTGGSQRLTIDSSGNVGIASTPTARLDVRRSDTDGKIAEFHQSTGYGIDIGSSTSDAYISSGYNQKFHLKTDAAGGAGQETRLTIIQNGKVGIGTTAPPDKLNVVGAVRINQSTALDHLCNAGTMLEVRGDGIGSGVVDTDFFKGFKLALNDGPEYGGQAQFAVGRFEENGTNARSSLMISLGHGAQSSSANADSDIMLLTSDGQVTIQDGDLKIGTAGHGINFSAYADGTGNPVSNLLDDYEEGSWTPAFDSNDHGGTFPVASYVKVGRLVSICLWATVGGGSDSSAFKVTGLPFSPDKNGSAAAATNCNLACFARIYDSSDRFEVQKFDATAVTYANLSDKYISINATYRCNP